MTPPAPGLSAVVERVRAELDELDAANVRMREQMKLKPLWYGPASHQSLETREQRAADLRALLSAVTWREIKDAPKDGTWILVYEPTEWEPRFHVVCWGDVEPTFMGAKHPKTWVTKALGPNPDTYEPDEATHFLPLPPSPEAR